jgi:hypothetical protein
MCNAAVNTFLSLIVTDYDNYEDFATTSEGEALHDELMMFCLGHDSLAIPELGIDFSIIDTKKAVTDHYESKTYYDLSVFFVDRASNEQFVLDASMFRAMDVLFGGITVRPQSAEDAETSAADESSNEAAPPTVLSAEEAQAVVDLLGAFFEDCGGEVRPSSDTPEGEAFDDFMISPLTGTTLTFGSYKFLAMSVDEEITNESDAWSLGQGTIELREISRGFGVTLRTGLFLGQSAEIRGITISCQNASFELDAD